MNGEKRDDCMEQMEQKLISIAVPVYNEQDNIDVLHQEIVRYMEPLPYRFELIFVDDGSKDATPLVLDRLTVPLEPDADPLVTAASIARRLVRGADA